MDNWDRLETYAIHLSDQVDAYAVDFSRAQTAHDCNVVLNHFELFLARVRVPQFVPALIRRFELSTRVKL